MKPSRLNTIAPSILTLTLAASVLPAQEVVELPGQDQRIEPDFEEVYRVGVLDGESWEMFGQVNQVAFDAEGNLYVFDGTGDLGGSGDLRVLVFDAAGGFLREFGSWGGGPGEFMRPVAFAVLRDGTTVVSDLGHRAYQLFDASGAFQRMVRAGDEPGLWVSRGIRPDPRGGAVFGAETSGGDLGFSVGSPGAAPPRIVRSRGSDSMAKSSKRTPSSRDGCLRETTWMISCRTTFPPNFATRSDK